jgi:dihydrodipicolinate synthase/N-acetylneuraminate lyase
MDALGADRVLAYCIPSHSNNEVTPDALATLAAEGLAGFKDSTMSAERHDEYVSALAGAGRDDFLLLVGRAALLVRSLRAGSAGAVLGIANLEPGLCRRLRDAAHGGGEEDVARMQAKLAEAEAAHPFPKLKRAVAERLRAEAGIDYGPHMRAPLGAAGSRSAQRA